MKETAAAGMAGPPGPPPGPLPYAGRAGRAGVGGARNILSFKQMKKLMNDYPFNYLEYEILMIHEDAKGPR